MDTSPFPYQGPLNPDQVHGRDELLRDLVGRVTERRVTALLGPRRYGKTSLLRRLASELHDVTTVWVDLYEVTSIADVAARFDAGLGASSGAFGELARRVAVGLSLNLGLLKVELNRPPRARPQPEFAFQSLLEVLTRTAQQHPTLLVVDEFSFISRVPGAAGALRTATQHHFQELGMIFAGSHPSMMRTMFAVRAEPFYGQADMVDISPLTAAAVEDIVTSGFAATGRDAGRLGGLIAAFAAGQPHRTMQLADACWRRTPAGGVGDAHWAEALQDVRRSTSEEMERIYSLFDPGERAVLRAIAQSGTLYGAEAELLDLSKGTATHARGTLLNSGDLVGTDDGIQLTDPLLADWLRRRFPL